MAIDFKKLAQKYGGKIIEGTEQSARILNKPVNLQARVGENMTTEQTVAAQQLVRKEPEFPVDIRTPVQKTVEGIGGFASPISVLGQLNPENRIRASVALGKTNVSREEQIREMGKIASENVLGTIGESRAIKPTSKLQALKGFPDLTTKFLEYAKGKTTLSKQEITDFARRPELKKGEAELLLKKLDEFTKETQPDERMLNEARDIISKKASAIDSRWKNEEITEATATKLFSKLDKLEIDLGLRVPPKFESPPGVKYSFWRSRARTEEGGVRGFWFDKQKGGFGKEISEELNAPYQKYDVYLENPLKVKDTKAAIESLWGGKIPEDVSSIYGSLKSGGEIEDFEEIDIALLDKAIMRMAQKRKYDAIIYEHRGPVGGEVQVFGGDKFFESAGGKTRKVDSKLPAQEFADSIRRDLLELKPVKAGKSFERMTIDKLGGQGIDVPDKFRSAKMGKNYEEVVFESPITTNGSSHYPNSKNYFAHARGDEVVENGQKIWREQEIQSDVLQKEGLNRMMLGEADEGVLSSRADVKQLQPFTNDRFGERIMRERIKEKAKKGYEKYRLPTGETIGKIEGFESSRWYHEKLITSDGRSILNKQISATEKLNVGKEIYDSNRQGWIITDILGGDGKFKAVPQAVYQRLAGKGEESMLGKMTMDEFTSSYRYREAVETFDLTGKSNPQYRRYSDWGKFLKNKFGGKEVIDPQKNSWVEIDLKKEYKRMPIEAFGVAALGTTLVAERYRRGNGDSTQR